MKAPHAKAIIAATFLSGCAYNSPSSPPSSFASSEFQRMSNEIKSSVPATITCFKNVWDAPQYEALTHNMYLPAEATTDPTPFISKTNKPTTTELKLFSQQGKELIPCTEKAVQAWSRVNPKLGKVASVSYSKKWLIDNTFEKGAKTWGEYNKEILAWNEAFRASFTKANDEITSDLEFINSNEMQFRSDLNEKYPPSKPIQPNYPHTTNCIAVGHNINCTTY